MSAQLIAKVSNLDGTVQEQMTLNQTLQQEVALANEMNDKMSEQEGKVRRLEAENTQYQEKIKKLQQVLMPDSDITLLSSTALLMAAKETCCVSSVDTSICKLRIWRSWNKWFRLSPLRVNCAPCSPLYK